MVVLAVVSCVGDNVFDRDVGRQLANDGFEVCAIVSGWHRPKSMAGSGTACQLGVTARLPIPELAPMSTALPLPRRKRAIFGCCKYLPAKELLL
jgi:hypothetical protein